MTEARANGFSEGELPERFAYTAADDKHAGTPAAKQGTEYRVLVVAEKYQTGFDQPLLAAERKATSDTGLRRAHAALYRFTDPARDRYVALAEDDQEAADGFRAALRDYTRMYVFLSQVVPYHDEELERLYLYGRALLNRLPRRQDPSVDIGEVELTHLRVSKTGEHDASLTPEGEQMLPGFVGGGAGPQHHPARACGRSSTSSRVARRTK